MGLCDPQFGGCNTGNKTGAQEGVGFAHAGGATHGILPFLTLCPDSINVNPEVFFSGAWIAMTASTIITTSPLLRKPSMNRPCQPNANFTLTPNSGAGGTTWSCRYKLSNKVATTYTNFTVQVNAPPSIGSPQIIIAT